LTRPAISGVHDIAASTASHPNVRDDREPPLFSGWDAENKSHISEKQKRIIFRERAGQEFARAGDLPVGQWDGQAPASQARASVYRNSLVRCHRN
jgi:nitrogen fixation protein FixH